MAIPAEFYIFAETKKMMGSKTKTILRGISILVVLLIVFMQLGIISINIHAVHDNMMWIMIIAYAMLLVTLK
jgi:hypothetical protein